MEETKTMVSSPKWVDDMQEWQKEDADRRAVFCVAVDDECFGGTLYGCALPVVAALLELMKTDEIYKNIISTAKEANDNPTCEAFLGAKWEEYKKEHGIKNLEKEEESEEKSSVKDFLKDLFQTLADKL